MKKIIKSTLILSTSILLSCKNDDKKLINIKGSDTVLPLSQEIIENYKQAEPQAIIAVTGGGSGVGIAALLNGNADIAQSSRKIKIDEQHKIESTGKKLNEVIIAYDALSVIVNPENKISKLTREQIEDIYTGEIKNWKEIGGDDLEIIPYSRETSSGTYEFFKESVLENKNYVNNILSMPATGGIIQSVSQTKGGIGYVGFAYLNTKVKSIAVSYDSGKTYISPTIENAKNKTYPIFRPLYYYYTDDRKDLSEFINYVESPQGQHIVSKIGFISIN